MGKRVDRVRLDGHCEWCFSLERQPLVHRAQADGGGLAHRSSDDVTFAPAAAMVDLDRLSRPQRSNDISRWGHAFGLYRSDRARDRRAGLVLPVACRPRPWTLAGATLSPFRPKPHSGRGLWCVSWVERDHRDHAPGRGPGTRIHWPFTGAVARRRGPLDDCPWLEDRGACDCQSLTPLRRDPFDCGCSNDRRHELDHAFLGLAVTAPLSARGGRAFGAGNERALAQGGRGRRRARAMQKHERRWHHRGQQRAVGLIEAERRQIFRRAPMQRRQGRTGTIDDGHGNKPRDAGPALPAIEDAKIIRPHQPNEMDAAAALLQKSDRLIRIGGADRGLDRRDFDARMMTDFSRRFDTHGERRQFPRVFQWIGGADKPPDAVEAQAPQREQAFGPMAVMRRIETAAEEANTQARCKGRHFGVRQKTQGRICPLPRTRYLNEVSCSSPTGPRACIRPVAMPISAPKPNSPPSANWVEALCITMAESTSFKKRSAAAGFSVTMQSV